MPSVTGHAPPIRQHWSISRGRYCARSTGITGWTHPPVAPADVGNQPYFDGRAECWVWDRLKREVRQVAVRLTGRERLKTLTLYLNQELRDPKNECVFRWRASWRCNPGPIPNRAFRLCPSPFTISPLTFPHVRPHPSRNPRPIRPPQQRARGPARRMATR